MSSIMQYVGCRYISGSLVCLVCVNEIFVETPDVCLTLANTRIHLLRQFKAVLLLAFGAHRTRERERQGIILILLPINEHEDKMFRINIWRKRLEENKMVFLCVRVFRWSAARCISDTERRSRLSEPILTSKLNVQTRKSFFSACVLCTLFLLSFEFYTIWCRQTDIQSV